MRNAFAIEVAERGEFASVDAFRSHIAAASVSDTTDADHHRTIAYASEGGSVALTYNLWDMGLIERRCDGAPYVAARARVGGIDGGGTQFLLSGGNERLGRATLQSAAGAWLIADDDARRYVAVNPYDAATPIRLATPEAEITCDAFPLGRIDFDEAGGVVRIETATDPGEVRVTPATIRVVINGAG